MQPCGDDWRFSDDRPVIQRRSSANRAGDDESRFDPDPRLQAHAVLSFDEFIGLAKRRYGCERGECRAYGIVFVRTRIAEIDEQAVADIKRDVTIMSFDCPRTGLMVDP